MLTHDDDIVIIRNSEILRDHVTYQWNIFSTTGCKRFSKMVGMYT